MTRWLVIGAKRMLGTDLVALLTTANGHGVANLATACANVGAALVQLSTEQHSGTQVRATATHAVPAAGGTWRVSGTKTWISRLTESAVFCVFFTPRTEADPPST
jgi:alkylation response protein AidB-like acyl-CoA dehydrogenase